MKFTAVFRKVPEGYIGFVEELPGANTQGRTLQEARSNLKEAIKQIVAVNRTRAHEFYSSDEVIKEPIEVNFG
jgi:predicted RNase H-like HicB family nuclease